MHASGRQKGRSAVELRLLGELQLVRHGEGVALPASRKTRALLGYLVATGEPQRREWLCDLLWDGPDDPRAELRWSLSKIRPLLDDGGTIRLRADRPRVVFAPCGAEVDLVTVRRLLSDISHAPLEALKSAVALFRGAFLDGLDLPACYRFQEWRLAERERMGALRIAALKALVGQLADRPSEALVHARALVAADPLSEEAHAHVIRLLGQLGRSQEALAQYEQARNVLRQELGAPVSSALEHARCTIKTATRTSTPLSPAEPPQQMPKTRHRCGFLLEPGISTRRGRKVLRGRRTSVRHSGLVPALSGWAGRRSQANRPPSVALDSGSQWQRRPSCWSSSAQVW